MNYLDKFIINFYNHLNVCQRCMGMTAVKVDLWVLLEQFDNLVCH